MIAVQRPSRLALLALLAPLTLLDGCGGGSSSGRGTAADSGSGDVAVLLADAPSDEYERILIDVAEISLLPLGGGDPVVLLAAEPPVEIDLLALREEDLVLTVKRGVPSGRYSKIRLRVPEIRPIGGPCEDLITRLPSGRIDLLPRAPIVVRSGRALFLRLDVDVDKSLHLHPAGGSGRCNFRPVVRVDVEADPPRDRCPRLLRGEIRGIDRERVEDVLATVTVDLPDARGELLVLLTEDTTIFDERGAVGGLTDLAPGDSIRVRGTLDRSGRLRASVVAVGELLVLEGEALGRVQDGRFALRPDGGQAVVSDLDVLLAPETLVLGACDREIDAELIRAGSRIRVAGKLDVADRALLASLVLVRSPALVSTEIESVRETDRGLELDLLERVGDGVRRFSVLLGEDVRIRLAGDGEVPLEILRSLLACRTLVASIVLDDVDPAIARSVMVDAERLDGRIATVDPVSRRVTLRSGESVQVLEGATILDLHADENEISELEFISIGAPARIFGLASCRGDDPDFHGFVLLLLMAPFDLEPACDVGSFAAHGHGGWGTRCSGGNPGCYRDEWFPRAFPDGLAIGCPDGNQALFTSSAAIETFLPNGGRSAALDGDHVDPRELDSGTLAGHTVALTLNVAFDDTDPAFRSGVHRLGSLFLRDSLSPCHGLSVDEILAEANAALGGCPSPFELSFREVKDCVSGALAGLSGGSGSRLVCPSEAGEFHSSQDGTVSSSSDRGR